MFTNDYLAPESIDEAITVLSSRPDAKLIAGGTDLLVQIRNRMINPGVLVDVRHLPFNDIEFDESHATIGSRVTYSQIIQSGKLREHFPAFVQASQLVGGPPTRNRGTLGGNLVNASPAADTIPPLLVYDAEVVIVGKAGQRIVPLCEFYTDYRQTQLAVGELLQAIRLPLPPVSTATHFIKHGKRRALYIAALNVAARISLSSDERVEAARIALGCVGPTVFLAQQVADVLQGKVLDEAQIAEAAKMATAAAKPISDVRASADYRTEIVSVLVKRALTEVAEKLRGKA